MEDPDVLTPEGMSSTAIAGQPADPSSEEPSPGDPPAGVERPRTVPYGALAEERARRKELQRALQESAGMRERLQGRLDALQALAAQAEPQGAQAVAGEDAEHPRHAHDATADLNAAAETSGAFRTQVLQSVRHFAAERPDFMEAYRHARQARVEELTALGYSPDEALAITFDNEREVINSAFAAGRNPAQVIYDFAVGRGYRPSNGNRVAAPGQGPAPRPVDGAATMTEAQKVALAARGQAAAKSLSAAGGGATGNLTLEALAGMSDEEFAEATRGDRWHRLLRG